MTTHRPPLREVWTPEQDEALRNAIDEGVSLERMSVRFNRPGRSIAMRAKSLGLVAKRAQRLAYADRIDYSAPWLRPRRWNGT
jgi:hypothetical protein